MDITVNNQSRTVQSDKLLLLLNDVLGEKTKGVAVAINQRIVSRAAWEKTLLKANDDVLIIKATQGG
jgi:sulfur carrier protein